MNLPPLLRLICCYSINIYSSAKQNKCSHLRLLRIETDDLSYRRRPRQQGLRAVGPLTEVSGPTIDLHP